jgi:DNA-binding NarL/FixJ family response regulator
LGAHPDPEIGSPPPRRVAIVDNQPITRSGLVQLAAAIPGLTVTASVASVEDLDRFDDVYDVVVMDVPGREDSLSPKTITRIAEISRPLIISSWDRPPSLLTAIRAGACGCVTKQSDHDVVACALTVVLAGRFLLCEQLVDRFHSNSNDPAGGSDTASPPARSRRSNGSRVDTPRGRSRPDWGCPAATINTYAKRIRRKLKVNNKAELTRIGSSWAISARTA